MKRILLFVFVLLPMLGQAQATDDNSQVWKNFFHSITKEGVFVDCGAGVSLSLPSQDASLSQRLRQSSRGLDRIAYADLTFKIKRFRPILGAGLGTIDYDKGNIYSARYFHFRPAFQYGLVVRPRFQCYIGIGCLFANMTDYQMFEELYYTDFEGSTIYKYHHGRPDHTTAILISAPISIYYTVNDYFKIFLQLEPYFIVRENLVPDSRDYTGYSSYNYWDPMSVSLGMSFRIL